MKTSDNIDDDRLKDIAPNLFSANKENPFDVPEGYFESLPDKISEKCFHPDNKRTNLFISKFPQRILIPFSIAATILIVALIFFKGNNYESNTTKQYAYAGMTNTSDYLENLINNNELDESLIVSELINDDTTKSGLQDRPSNFGNAILNTNIDFTTDSLNKNKITKDDIIQYLLENDESDDLLN